MIVLAVNTWQRRHYSTASHTVIDDNAKRPTLFNDKINAASIYKQYSIQYAADK